MVNTKKCVAFITCVNELRLSSVKYMYFFSFFNWDKKDDFVSRSISEGLMSLFCVCNILICCISSFAKTDLRIG